MADRREDGRVSVWVGFERHAPQVDLLRELYGVAHYDLDSQEVIVDAETWRQRPVADLMGDLSYSESFLSEALAAAEALGIREALFLVAQYDFAYDPKTGERVVAPDPVFLGSFGWTDDED